MLKGLGQLGDMAKLMKQAQDMQSKMSDIQNLSLDDLITLELLFKDSYM